MRNGIIVIAFLMCAGLGLWVSENSWDGKVYVYMGRERGPAAVKSISDYSPLESSSLSQTALAQLLNDVRLNREDGFMGVKLGHVLVQTENGARDFACMAGSRPGMYDRIELTFMGEGIAEGDSPPKMVVDAKCKSSLADLERLDTIWIPMADMLTLPAKNQDLKSRGEEPTFIRLEHMASAWPESWSLFQVKLYREGSPDSFLKIDAADMLKNHIPRVGFDWKRDR